MPIKMIQTERGHGPIVICDYCGDRIERATDGNYEWRRGTGDLGSLSDVLFVHKRCARSNEAKLGEPLQSMELNVFVPYLADNLQVDWEDAQTHAAVMAGDEDAMARWRASE